MSPFAAIEERYASLSRTFRSIADYISKNYKIIPFSSVQQIGNEAGVSTASVVRFCQEIGYTGYAEFQQDLQKLIRDETPPMLEFRTAVSEVEANPLEEMFRLNIEILKKSYSDLLATEFQKAIETLAAARRIYVIGLRSSYTAAYYAHNIFSQFMPNVDLVTANTYDLFDRISYAGGDDAALVCSFSKYSRLTVEATDLLRERGVTVIGLTDAMSSPVATRSDIVLLAKTSSKSYSFVTALTIINALAVAIGQRDKAGTLSRLKEVEAICSKNSVYFRN